MHLISLPNIRAYVHFISVRIFRYLHPLEVISREVLAGVISSEISLVKLFLFSIILRNIVLYLATRFKVLIFEPIELTDDKSGFAPVIR